MVKRRKTSTTRKQPQKRGLEGLKMTAAQERRQALEEAELARAQDEAERSGFGGGAPALSSFGLLHTRSTADYHASGGRDARITLRLHPDLRDLLIIVARRENRTLSQLVELALIDFAQLHLRRLTEADLRALGWDDAKIESLGRDPHPFARHLYERLKSPL